MIAQLALQPGHRVLHFGGDEAALRAAVGAEGIVTATTLDSELPHHANSFDAAWVQEQLIGLADPAGAVGELAWVVRAGGRIALCEADWASLAIASEDRATTAIITAEIAAGRGDIGRHLPRLLAAAGCHRISIGAETLVLDLATLDEVAGLAIAREHCVRAKKITAEAAEAWWDGLQELDRDGGFYGALTFVRAVGVVMG